MEDREHFCVGVDVFRETVYSGGGMNSSLYAAWKVKCLRLSYLIQNAITILSQHRNQLSLNNMFIVSNYIE